MRMKIDKLYEGLTEKQRRRTELRARGLKICEIATIEGVYMRAICSSLELAEKKMRRNVKKYAKNIIIESVL